LKANRCKRIICALISALVLSGVFDVSAITENSGLHEQEQAIDQLLLDLNSEIYKDKTPYQIYKKGLIQADDSKNKQSIVITSQNVVSVTGDSFKTGEAFKNKENTIITDESGSVKFSFNVDSPGFYGINFYYHPINMEKNECLIQRRMLINDDLLFFECNSITFDRFYTSKTDSAECDTQGNQIKPVQHEISDWFEMSFQDRLGKHDGLYEIYFEKGLNTLELVSLRESMALEKIVIYEIQTPDTYEEVKNSYPLPENFFEIIQAENADRVNDIVLQPTADKSSTCTIPYSTSVIRYNIIGQNFKKPGHKLEWNVNVESDGMYNLAFRLRQYSKRDFSTYFAIKINGETPYLECGEIKLKYGDSWQFIDKTSNQAQIKVPLKKGDNTVAVELVSGANSVLENQMEASVLRLNYCYQKIIMLTGSEPDKNRDYQFKKLIPDILRLLEYEGQTLGALVKKICEETGQKGSDAVAMENLALQIQSMYKDPYTIADQLENFRVNLSAAAVWLTTLKDISVDADYIVIYSDDRSNEIPRQNDNLWSSFIKSAKELIASFFTDYNSVGKAESYEKDVTVWVGSGRDQAQIIKNLSSRGFSPEKKIGVDVKLVNNAMLMPSIMAKTAPDIAVLQGNMVQLSSQGVYNQVGTLAVEWGLRGALYPLNDFPDMQEILESRFYKSTYEPLGQEGKYFALPEAQGFPILFYRKDILNELKIEIPKTWDDVKSIIPILQDRHMGFGLNYDFNTFCTLLYQHGGELYNDSRTSVMLDSPQAIDAFTFFTQFSTVYKLPLKIDFNNRFRSGEMPLGISDISTYNVLQILAPEIEGLWGYAPVPGTAGIDGEINDTVVGMPVTSCFITNNTKDAAASWEFLKWWTDDKTQTEYSREIESVLGPSGRNIPAGKQAFANLPWTNEDMKILQNQLDKTREIPQPIGGYMVVRQFENAFRAVTIGKNSTVYNNGMDPRSSMLKYVVFMNRELMMKKEEIEKSVQ